MSGLRRQDKGDRHRIQVMLQSTNEGKTVEIGRMIDCFHGFPGLLDWDKCNQIAIIRELVCF